MISIDEKWLNEKLLKRFIEYVQIETTSNPASKTYPSTPGQTEFAKILTTELKEIGLVDTFINDDGFLIARLPAVECEKEEVIGYLAHLDTTPDVTGRNVKPQIHENYNGEKIELNDEKFIDPVEFPELREYIGETIITTDGTTLLGADDKAGVAEIMTAIEFLLLNSTIPHPAMEIIFTPDEETGRGMDRFPYSSIKSSYCYTFDGDGDGIIEAECFEAYKVTASIEGKNIHLGQARGKMVNAISLAGALLEMLPKQESPEATDGRFGYYCPISIEGHTSSATVVILIRDFESAECLRRIETIKQIASCLESIYPGGKIMINLQKQYGNLINYLSKSGNGLILLEEAIRRTGTEPVYKSIRGGTDGARLSESGIPAPNVFAGGRNFHSIYEWIPLSSMARAVKTAVHLAHLWAKK